MNIVNVSFMIDLTPDLMSLIPDHVIQKMKSFEIFGDLQYSYENVDHFEIGTLVVVPIRNREVVGRIESITTEINPDIQYKQIVRAL